MNDKSERRQHQRYKVDEDVFAVMGTGAEIMGRVQEMGKGGLSFTYRDNNRKIVPVHTIQTLSILSDGDNTARNEPSKFNVRIISDTHTEEDTVFDSSTMKRVGIQFNDLTFYQRAWLLECIRKYTLDGDEISGAKKKE